MRSILLAGFLLPWLCLPTVAGPWPRGEGHGFLSVSTEYRINRAAPLAEPVYDGSVYAEYGLRPRLTFGADLYQASGNHTYLLFLRRSLGPVNQRHRFAFRFGIGTRADAVTAGEALYLLGGSWGRGFDSRWGPGWGTLDGQIRQRPSGGREVKVDATLGFAPAEDWRAILQIQTASFPGADISARLQATGVRRLNKRLSLEAGVVYGIRNDALSGLKLGFWTAF